MMSPFFLIVKKISQVQLAGLAIFLLFWIPAGVYPEFLEGRGQQKDRPPRSSKRKLLP
jgi:hypothetical protein